MFLDCIANFLSLSRHVSGNACGIIFRARHGRRVTWTSIPQQSPGETGEELLMMGSYLLAF